MENETLLTPQKFGVRFNPPLSAQWVRQLVDSGQIKAVRTPTGRRLIALSELRRFQAERDGARR